MVIQGNNGTVLQVKIRDKRAFVDLTDATVKLVIRCGNRKFIKDAAVTGLGQVELALSLLTYQQRVLCCLCYL
jgi:hypothetical protein